MISNMLTMHECVVLTVMQKLLIVWTCYLLVISLYTTWAPWSAGGTVYILKERVSSQKSQHSFDISFYFEHQLPTE